MNNKIALCELTKNMGKNILGNCIGNMFEVMGGNLTVFLFGFCELKSLA